MKGNDAHNFCSSLRCEDSAVLQPCNATSDTVCATNPQSGKGLIPSLKSVKVKVEPLRVPKSLLLQLISAAVNKPEAVIRGGWLCVS